MVSGVVESDAVGESGIDIGAHAGVSEDDVVLNVAESDVEESGEDVISPGADNRTVEETDLEAFPVENELITEAEPQESVLEIDISEADGSLSADDQDQSALGGLAKA